MSLRKKRRLMYSSPVKTTPQENIASALENDNFHAIEENKSAYADDFLDNIEDEEAYFRLTLPDPEHIPSAEMVEEVKRPEDGKVTRVYADQRREVIFPNGVRRETWGDGYSVVYFTNGDIKQSFPTRTLYHFSE